jgi:hypothetical protein
MQADGSFLYTFPKNFVGTVEFAPLPSAANGSTLTVRKRNVFFARHFQGT